MYNCSYYPVYIIFNLFYPEIIAIASSTGGPEALTELLKGFSCSFLSNKIILITQHIKKDFISFLDFGGYVD